MIGKSINWMVNNKTDLAGDKLWKISESRFSRGTKRSFAISAATGMGVDGLVEALRAFASDFFASTEAPVTTRARHRAALERTVAALDRAVGEGESGREEVVAEELRLAATELGRLTGRVDVEDILDVIFRDFCIGK
jgi:tRNA modification GTPase